MTVYLAHKTVEGREPRATHSSQTFTGRDRRWFRHTRRRRTSKHRTLRDHRGGAGDPLEGLD